MSSFSPLESDRSAPGLVAWLESTRVRLPLKGLECRFEVTGGIASVELDQIFFQDNAKPLDCTYSFPLPAGAAVYRCEMHLNGRVIRAKVEEQAAARKIYAERKAAGQRAALVETERENLFTLSLGNVQPQDLVVIRFAFFQKLDRLNRELSLQVPLCPGIRYIPGKPLLRSPSGRGTTDDTNETPDASRISPPRIDALHPDAAYFYCRGRIAASDAEMGSISSPSHPLIARQDSDGYTIELATQDAVPDRDLVLRWQEPIETALKPRAWQVTRDHETFALVELRAPRELSVVSDTEGQDFYFLIDRSGSMEGAKWTQTCAGLQAFVGLLGLRDRVSLTLFETDHSDFAEGPLPVSTLREDARFRGLVGLGVAGGTNLLPALQHVLKLVAKHTTSKQRNARLVLITDGQVGNEATIIEEMQRQVGLPMYVLGIDTAVNDAFLKSLGRVTGGGCTLQTPADDITATVKRLGARLQHPALTHLVSEGDWQPATDKPINLYAADAVTISLRGGADLNAPIVLRGKRADGSEQRFEIQPERIAHEAIPLLWAREKITTALDRDDNAAAIALACRYTLLCKGAAFVAWDELERVQVATETLYQPAQAPDIAPCMAACAPAPYPSGVAAPKKELFRKRAKVFHVEPSADESLADCSRMGMASEPPSWTSVLELFRFPPSLMSELRTWFASLPAVWQQKLLAGMLRRSDRSTLLKESHVSIVEFGRNLSQIAETELPAGPKRTACLDQLKDILARAHAGSQPV